ncbi:unnamed protein product [Candidula unifasciata]|uniref:Selenoprotein O n=1 Tax=Candidula unifasciata TaxID=100452 RepID=A0A8S3YYJ4_9EUPU|nr:unnamed protein product [Candidula unifasciata]
MSTKLVANFVVFVLLINNLLCHRSNACSLSGYLHCILSFKCCPVCFEKVSRGLGAYGRYASNSPSSQQICNSNKEYILNKSDCPLYVDFRQWLPKLTQKFINIFPIDSEIRNHVRTVNNALFSIVQPVSFKNQVRLVIAADDVLSDCLDLGFQVTQSALFIDFISGNARSGLFSHTLAHRYGGHQFGFWAGQLGDGRAVLLGEVINRFGERWELQLKGSGTTPYSRSGDGRAVLRSSVREFLASEAMHYLGVPTSRAASLVVSDDTVIRDQFYNGHPKPERGAIILRLAPSWFRIGSLEILSRAGEIDLLKSLLNFIIGTHFPSINPGDTNKYLMLFDEIVSSTAKLIAKWQSVGFTHGVCNTDNFSLLSITIDYGPFGFMESYHPGYVPSTSDDDNRYSYKNQPNIGLYNLEKLKLALDSVFNHSMSHTAQLILNGYRHKYNRYFMQFFADKLGFLSVRQQDEDLIAMFLRMMEECRADFTMSFRSLSEIPFHDLMNGNIADDHWSFLCLKNHSLFKTFIVAYKDRLQLDDVSDLERQARMKKCNPRYILRNWMAQNAIAKAERNDFSEVQKLYQILKQPYITQDEPETAGFASEPPEWAPSIKVSCSS